MMSRAFCVTIFILLQLCFHGHSCPKKCQCFTPARVICSDEGRTDMPHNLSSSVRELVVMTTGIVYLRSGAFPESSKLSKLVFINNLLQGVSRLAFNSLVGLEELEISGNPRLEDLHLGTLSALRNLTTLLLNYNRFSVLTGGLFHMLHKLETLQLKGNAISRLPEDLFQKLGRLRLLDLSLNVISSVRKEFFRNLGQLQTLRLGYNRIDVLLPDAFDGVPSLRELSLQSNKITRLPQALFSRLANLEKLNLQGNLIEMLAASVFPPGLTELNLADNRLAQLSPATFQGLPQLTRLLLSQNQLSVIQEDLFQNLTALERLDLSNNVIGSLAEASFRGLSELQVVHLENNNISSLGSGLFEDQDYLEQLYLSNNTLQSIPDGFFNPVVAQNMIRLHDNPWTCDCRLLYLYDWLVFGMGWSQDMSGVYCRAPAFLRGRGLVSLNREQLVCEANSSAPLQSAPRLQESATPRLEESATATCTVQETQRTVSVKCPMQKCPQLKLLTWYRRVGNPEYSVTEHIFTQGTQCLNATVTITF